MAFAQPNTQTVTTQKLCRELTAYQPSADVEYKAGSDVRGRSVAPADLNDDGAAPIQMPEIIDMAITVEQATQLGLPANIPYRPQAYIGNVSVMKDGTVYFNNKRISQTQIQTLCEGNKN